MKQNKSVALATVIVAGSIGFTFSTLVVSEPAFSEDVMVPIGHQAEYKKNVERPPTGMSSEKVREKFGEPLDWKEPVGDPPISRWEYQDFVVYFEYDHVVHTVMKYSSETASISQQ